MLRVSPASKQAAYSLRRAIARVPLRRLATETSPPTPGASSVPPQVPKKKTGIFRRLFLYTTLLTGTFYLGGTLAAFNNERYHDFFVESVPLGEAITDYVEEKRWDKIISFRKPGASTSAPVQKPQDPPLKSPGSDAKAKISQAKDSAIERAKVAKATVNEKLQESKEKLKVVRDTVRTNVEKGAHDVERQSGKAIAIARHQAEQISDGLDDLIRQAEAALAGKPIRDLPDGTITSSQPSAPDTVPPRDNDTSEPNVLSDLVSSHAHVYDKPLPIGFEAPPGFARPPSSREASTTHPPVEAEAGPDPLPLLAPAVASFSVSEPIITHLASTIDTLAAFLNANPTAASKAHDVLDTAKIDLTNLAERIDKAKEEERLKLEAELDEQAKDYTLKLLQLEMDAQDKIDSQEEGFRRFYDEEKLKFAQAYREKLNRELQTQSELINERLKEEVIAQGIEMQRRWIREIKVRVEEERGGRLSKLDEIAASLKRLERITLDNSSYLDENLRLHALWSALRAVQNVFDAPVRRPFREELRVLRHVAGARDDPVVASALDSIESTDVPDVGVEPLADLATWFSSSVAPNVANVALVPDQNAGVLSHLASHLVSSFRFQRHGLVPGSDVVSVLARAEHYLNEKDLDSAARELNQLQGTAKTLLADWLIAARRRLEVQQAIEVVQAQATFSSLLVV